MSEHRSEIGSAWQTPSHSAVYLDSAYKALLREELRCMALKNRSKVLELSQEHLLRQAENSRVKLQKLKDVKSEIEEQQHRLSKHREKIKMTQEEQHFANREIRKAHSRQMSNVALEKAQEMDVLRVRANKMREEHLQAIDRNRQNQLDKKKRSHDKVHQALADSRSTVQNFYANKQRNIIEQTQKQVRNLNMRKTRQQLQSIGVASRKILEIQTRVKCLRENVAQRSVPIAAKRPEGEVHPLVRRIESVLNQYTKIL